MDPNPYQSPKEAGGGAPARGERRAERPWWVVLGLWGVPGRDAAWMFFLFSLAAASGCILYGFVNQWFFAGGLLLFSALWYYACIRWVDENDRWE